MADRAVYIHSNAKQLIGALVAQHSLRRNSAAPERFDVEIIMAEDFEFLRRQEGKTYLREGKRVTWTNDDLQSFTPLRFAVPSLRQYQGRAVLMDPDIFAVGDINELLDADMGQASLLARRMAADGRRPLHYASSVMLLDCARLTHWNADADFQKTFDGTVDYRDWMWLLTQPEGSIGTFGDEWNDFDHLDHNTKLLHNTHRRTQPWKTGLRADFTSRGTTFGKRLGIQARKALAAITGGSPTGYYSAHPDPAQERFFFGLLGECLDNGSIGASLLEAEIQRGHVRADALELVRKAGRKPAPQAAAA